MQSISNPTWNLEGAFGRAVDLADSISKHFKEAAVEMADMSFDEFDRCTELVDELLEARTLAGIVEIQTDYLKCCHRAFAQSARRLGRLCLAISEDMAKPITEAHPAAAACGRHGKGRARSEDERHFPLPGRGRERSAARKSHAARRTLLHWVAAER